MDIQLLIGSFVAILALVNPIQKIFIITSLQNQFSDKELRFFIRKINTYSTENTDLLLVPWTLDIQLCISYTAVCISGDLWYISNLNNRYNKKRNFFCLPI